MQAGAGEATLRRRACRCSSDRRPRTTQSEGSSCYEGSCWPSAKPDADKLRTASVFALPIRRHVGSRSAHTRSRPASDKRPDTAGRLLRWQNLLEIRAESSETEAAAPHYTTASGLLKQPDKQKEARLRMVQHTASGAWCLDRSHPF